jgi:hypothetical protein
MKALAIVLIGILTTCAAKSQSIPSLLLVHNDFYSAERKPSIDKLIAELKTDGPFRFNLPLMKTVACKSTADLWTTFSDEDVLTEALRLHNLRDLDSADLKEIKDLVKPPPVAANPQSKKGSSSKQGNNRWSVSAYNYTLLNVVKSMGLRKAKILSGDSRLLDAQRALLPIVYIFMPAKSVVIPNPNNPGGPPNVTHGRTFKDMRNSISRANYIGLSTSALLTGTKQELPSAYTTLAHETGHYLMLWHTFVDSDDLKFTYPTRTSIASAVQKAAGAIKNEKQCAAPTQFKDGKIQDVDYFKSQRNVGDTVPLWKKKDNPSTDCVEIYKKLAPNMQDPTLNIMNYPDKSKVPFKYARNNAKAALSEDQAAVVREELTHLLTFGAPENLCRP